MAPPRRTTTDTLEEIRLDAGGAIIVVDHAGRELFRVTTEEPTVRVGGAAIGGGPHSHAVADLPDSVALEADVEAAIATHAATPHGGDDHPDVTAHDELGLATDAALEAGLTAAIDAHLAGATHGTADGIPAGVIVMWGGLVSAIPSGWALCDGANGTPDLRDRFIVGAAAAADPGATGGTSTHTHAGHSDHGALTHAGTAIADHTVNQPAAHSNHVVTQPSAHTEVMTHTHVERGPSAATGGLVGWTPDTSTNTSVASGYSTDAPAGAVSSIAHSGSAVDAHSAHSGTAVSAHGVTQPNQHAAQSHSGHDSPSNLPPFYALAFIQKLAA